MATLKELRDEEIKIDMDIGPIEVGTFFFNEVPFRLRDF